jgi:hypothetical protein
VIVLFVSAFEACDFVIEVKEVVEERVEEVVYVDRVD